MSRGNRIDIIDLTGQRFGKLVVITRAESKNGARWLCKCDCGIEKVIQGGHLRSGSTESCGCDKLSAIARGNRKHGETKTRLYKIWIGMKSRCYDERHIAWHRYGGRGIRICPDWLYNFEAFRDWALANGYSENLTIDREKNDQGYYPANCRWITAIQQQANKSTTRFIEFGGERLPMSHWARRIGITPQSLSQRIKAGWPLEDALACS